LLIADTPESFASGLIDLLQDRVRRQTYEEAAAALAARYDWSQITAAFAAVLQNTIDNFYRA
jgi:glycosyltransferase involved in cell wall biosynthesis